LTNGIRFIEGDAEALKFDDACFDSVVSLYAWRHLPDPVAATAEAFRVLRAGGSFVLAVGSSPALMSAGGVRAALAAPWRKISQKRGLELSACDHLDALIEKYLPRPKHIEVAEWTIGHHSLSGSLKDLILGAGFRLTGNRWAGRSYTIDTADHYWRLQATFSSIARKRIAEAAPDEIANLKAEFHKQCAAVQARGGELVYRVGAMIFSAVKP
jgi:SAM-dependent methyltransferase